MRTSSGEGASGSGARMGKPAVAAEAGDQIAAGRVDVGVVGRQVGRAPALDRLGERAMAIGEERPVEESLVRH